MEQISLQLKSVNPKVSVCSYEENYYCADNFAQSSDPKTRPCEPISNDEYYVCIGIIQGNMKLKLNGALVKLKSNDYLVITPFTLVEIIEARCKFFMTAVRGVICVDLFNMMGMEDNVMKGCYTFHHFHMYTQQMGDMEQSFRTLRQCITREVPIKKEDLIKARLSIYCTQAQDSLKDLKEIPHVAEGRNANLFSQFIALLDKDYIKEREVQYYAEQIGLLPKGLTSVAVTFAGKTASRIIDDYVAFYIKVALYNTKCNIGEVGEQFNFPSPSFFGRYFKRVTGLTPREYINMFSRNLAQ